MDATVMAAPCKRSGFICGFIISDEKLEALVCPNWKGGKMEEADYERLADEFGERLQTLYDRWNMWKIRGARRRMCLTENI